jgi:hypothetical protein
MPLFKLTRKFKNYVNAFEGNGSKEICSKEEFKSIITKERARADRNNQELSLLIFDLETSDLKKTNIISLIREIRSRIRLIDEMGWYDDWRIGMILPYTSNKGAIKLAENIYDSLDGIISKSVCTVYTYPLDKLHNIKR